MQDKSLIDNYEALYERMFRLIAGDSEADGTTGAPVSEGDAMISNTEGNPQAPTATVGDANDSQGPSPYFPRAPRSLEEVGIQERVIEGLILRYLMNHGVATGREICTQMKLPYAVLQDLLRAMKEKRLVVYKASAPMADYLYEITESGLECAKRISTTIRYFGAVPVPLAEYTASMATQSIRKQSPTFDDLRRAFDDLVLSDEMVSQLGQAVLSGLGLFLYGSATVRPVLPEE